MSKLETAARQKKTKRVLCIGSSNYSFSGLWVCVWGHIDREMGRHIEVKSRLTDPTKNLTQGWKTLKLIIHRDKYTLGPRDRKPQDTSAYCSCCLPELWPIFYVVSYPLWLLAVGFWSCPPPLDSIDCHFPWFHQRLAQALKEPWQV